MPTPFVADAADEAVRSESILNERKAADIIEETALEVDIRAWRAEGLRLLQAASAREDHVPNGARRPCSARCVVLSELRKSHFLRAIGVVSSSAIAATLRGVKRARQLSPASLRRRVVQFQRDSPMRFFFLPS